MNLPFSFTPLAHWLTLLVGGLRQAAAARAGRTTRWRPSSCCSGPASHA